MQVRVRLDSKLSMYGDFFDTEPFKRGWMFHFWAFRGGGFCVHWGTS